MEVTRLYPELAAAAGTAVTRIGAVAVGDGVVAMDASCRPVPLPRPRYWPF